MDGLHWFHRFCGPCTRGYPSILPEAHLWLCPFSFSEALQATLEGDLVLLGKMLKGLVGGIGKGGVLRLRDGYCNGGTCGKSSSNLAKPRLDPFCLGIRR